MPAAHVAFVDRVQTFVGKVAGRLARFPIPAGTTEGDRSVREAVADGLSAAIEDHRAAIAEFDDDTRQSTFRRSAERIRTTRFKLEAYSDLLSEEKARLDRELTTAIEELKAKVLKMGEPEAAGVA